MKKKLQNLYFNQIIVGIVTLTVLYFTFGLSTIDYKGEMFKIAHLFMCVVSSLAYFLFDAICFKNSDSYKQVYKLNYLFHIVTILLVIFGIADSIVNGFDYYLISKCIFAAAFVILAAKRRHYRLSSDMQWRTYIGLMILVVISLILMYNPYFFSFKWDGLLYHETFSTAELFKISSLGFYGHISQGAGIPVAIIQCLTFGNTELAIYILNSITMIVGALAFFGIIRKLVPGRNTALYTVLTAVYVWSPWVLGMSDYANIDYYCANWFVVVLYFTVSKQFYLQVVSGLFYAMVKEPAIIIYGCLCIGVLLVDFYENKSKVFMHARYYGMLMVALIWLITLKFMGMWSLPGSEAKIESSHFLEQAGILYVFNFSWLIWGLVLILLVLLCIYKKRGIDLRYRFGSLIPMVFSLLAFTLFNFVFVTVPNPRYSDIIPICGYVMIATYILALSEHIPLFISYVLGTALAAVMLISSYLSVDPISSFLYKDDTLADKTVYTTTIERHMYGDASVYNKQALYMEGVISQAVENALENEWNIILCGDDTTSYYLDGMLGNIHVPEGDFLKVSEYFDKKNKIRKIHPNENTVEYEVAVVNGENALTDFVSGNKKYMCLYFKGLGDESVSVIADKYKVVSEHEYEYRGWKLYGIVFE